MPIKWNHEMEMKLWVSMAEQDPNKSYNWDGVVEAMKSKAPDQDFTTEGVRQHFAAIKRKVTNPNSTPATKRKATEIVDKDGEEHTDTPKAKKAKKAKKDTSKVKPKKTVKQIREEKYKKFDRIANKKDSNFDKTLPQSPKPLGMSFKDLSDKDSGNGDGGESETSEDIPEPISPSELIFHKSDRRLPSKTLTRSE